MSIVYLGPAGSYHESAAQVLYPNHESHHEFLPLPNFTQIFGHIQTSDDIAVVAIENTIGGDIEENFSQLITSEYKILKEMFLQIRHNVLALPGTDWSKVNKIYMHPQSKLQCSNFLNLNPQLKQVLVSSNSEGAKIVANETTRTSVAIGGLQASRIYNLDLFKTQIGNFPLNFTRFVSLQKSQSDDSVILELQSDKLYKFSIVFELPHQVGSLYKILENIAQNQGNLTKIESRPIPDTPFNYRFFVDFKHVGQFNFESLRDLTAKLSVIGIYEPGIEVQES